jgi:hypothetical protein
MDENTNIDNSEVDNNVSSNEELNNDVKVEELKADQDLIEKLVKERLDEQLKPIKEKLDNAYTARDEALKKAAEFEQKEKEAHKKQLEEEGKYKELYELQLAEERARREALEKRNVELTRDIRVKDALKDYDFRNSIATEMAYKEIVPQLMQDENGTWKHRSGVAIEDYIKSFASDENNSFLFKAKISSGAGTTSSKPSNTASTEGKSLFELSQEEVIKMAMEGKLPSL